MKPRTHIYKFFCKLFAYTLKLLNSVIKVQQCFLKFSWSEQIHVRYVQAAELLYQANIYSSWYDFCNSVSFSSYIVQCSNSISRLLALCRSICNSVLAMYDVSFAEKSQAVLPVKFSGMTSSYGSIIFWRSLYVRVSITAFDTFHMRTGQNTRDWREIFLLKATNEPYIQMTSPLPRCLLSMACREIFQHVECVRCAGVVLPLE